ncbi:Pc21g07580 [Penicillium rubens Wisconsin 54-1255]|uniref:Pc21g07580 protein n=1 Tax=Penicillium rubens (strain ATCC 28089 / DSM 1075 / NRRL 1951 / Wisconsin 54-1255) TaxID=500485 RepID=B6HKU1_PENRW|nr:Pc21g07580 [Penicillium rubens Wisconsin 54-1255]
MRLPKPIRFNIASSVQFVVATGYLWLVRDELIPNPNPKHKSPFVLYNVTRAPFSGYGCLVFPRPTTITMDFDHAEKKYEQKAAAWNLWWRRSPETLSMLLAKKHRPGEAISACLWKSGAFNICHQVRYENGPDVIVRFAALGRAILRREKVQIEVAAIKYIRKTTWINVPEVFGSGNGVCKFTRTSLPLPHLQVSHRLLPDACFAASLPSPTTATRCCQHRFLEVLSDHESRLIEQQLLSESQRVSPRMKDYMETGLS